MTEFYSGDPGDEHCDHDWRVNPHLIYTTNPPQRQLVCANCGTKRASGLSRKGYTNLSDNNPRNWERWSDA